MFSKSRNAQISIFVIIGAIIILGGVFLFTVDFEGITIFDDQRSSYLIREYVESCVEGQTKEGVYLLGVHGGWLYNDIREEFFLTKDTNEYLIKDKLGYVDMGGIEQPYWYYYDDGDEEFRTNIPEFDTKNEYSMKNQLKRYLDETLEPLCIKNFQSFKDKFEVEYDKSEISHEVIFNEDEIIVRLNLPLEIRELNEESTEYIDTFSIDHPNELYVPYHLAKDIIDAESNSSFVEYKLMGLLTPYQDPNSVDLLVDTKRRRRCCLAYYHQRLHPLVR